MKLTVKVILSGTPSAGSPPSASSKADVSAPVEIVFEVVDDGIGISEKNIATLFQSFHQVESMHRQYGGTGLGQLCYTKAFE